MATGKSGHSLRVAALASADEAWKVAIALGESLLLVFARRGSLIGVAGLAPEKHLVGVYRQPIRRAVDG